VVRLRPRELKLYIMEGLFRKLVYIAHPISGDVDANLADLARVLRIINLDIHPLRWKMRGDAADYDFSNIIPIAPYYADIIALDDTKPLERKRGMDNGLAIILTGIFDELWLTGNTISLGMKEEIKLFRSLGTPIIDYTNKI